MENDFVMAIVGALVVAVPTVLASLWAGFKARAAVTPSQLDDKVVEMVEAIAAKLDTK
jgi:hypothetical protein